MIWTKGSYANANQMTLLQCCHLIFGWCRSLFWLYPNFIAAFNLNSWTLELWLGVSCSTIWYKNIWRMSRYRLMTDTNQYYKHIRICFKIPNEVRFKCIVLASAANGHSILNLYHSNLSAKCHCQYFILEFRVGKKIANKLHR